MRGGRVREVAWCRGTVKTGGCREGRLDALVVVVVVVLVDSGAVVADLGFRGRWEIGGTGTIDILGVAGYNTSRGETDDCVCAIAMQDSKERVVGKGSESDLSTGKCINHSTSLI